MQYSNYQEAIFDSVKSTKDSLMIEAVAGSGKTTTIIQASKLIPPTQSCLFLAFNKKIADDLKERLPSNVKAQTLNSLGWNICKANIPWFKTNGFKTRNLYFYELNNYDKLTTAQKSELYFYKEDMETYISLLKAYCVTTSEEYDRMIPWISEHYSLDLPEYPFKQDLRKIFLLGATYEKVLDFDDQIYLSAIHTEWKVPQFDVIFVDEAQDLSEIQAKLIRRVLSPKGRVIFVGDSKQAIYGFRGASVDSMDKLSKEFNCKLLPLSISYRCASRIVAEAKTICSQIESYPEASQGTVLDMKQDFLSVTNPEDLVLCRTINPLRLTMKQLILSGKPVNFCYPELLKELSDIATFLKNKVGALNSSKIQRASEDKQEQLLKKGAKRKIPAIIEQYNLLDTVVSLYPHESNYTTLFNTALSDPRGVKLMSIHKAKGLESDGVIFLNQEDIPHRNATLPWEITQEYNMKYVGITRAKKELYYGSI
jgi:DNA helicase-2/ATP-dependent DNA helicase PcrA